MEKTEISTYRWKGLEGETRIIWEGYEEALWGDGNVLYLDRSLVYTGVCIYQNSLNGILKICVFHCT